MDCDSCRRTWLGRMSTGELLYPRKISRETISRAIWEVYPHHEREVQEVGRFISHERPTLHIYRSADTSSATSHIYSCWDFSYVDSAICPYHIRLSDTLVWCTRGTRLLRRTYDDRYTWKVFKRSGDCLYYSYRCIYLVQDF